MPPKKGIGTSSPTSKEAADLERIRNNQRRCRARQKSYIAELEARVRHYESTQDQASAVPKLQELMNENESLKRLLNSLGLDVEFVEAYGKATKRASEIVQTQPKTQRLCEPSLAPASSKHTDTTLQFGLTSAMGFESAVQETPMELSGVAVAGDIDQHFLSTNKGSTQEDTFPPCELFDFSAFDTLDIELLQTRPQPQSEALAQFAEESSAMGIPELAMSMEETLDKTTLCSLAFSLILKNNVRGYSTADIDLKLRVGYRDAATPFEGCRVDNKVLFTVLAEIS
ncbi:hypothetical protein B0J11DRAFT_51280 [Dendryphion nanum]|uniref:BZIP domain-containing protein n=1 Tax=Dendryphion nanum TaxID=256645 RepID=A0A9P9IHK3_9PLEO|nr:hypothetical protein B0J11DRAFT_51280 [Dendryphion nanum]